MQKPNYTFTKKCCVTGRNRGKTHLGVVNVAADKSSPLRGADLGLSRTGSLRRFFFRAANGLGPKRGYRSNIQFCNYYPVTHILKFRFSEKVTNLELHTLNFHLILLIVKSKLI